MMATHTIKHKLLVAYYCYPCLQWLSIFRNTVDELFAGEVADKAKHFAEGIAENLGRQITQTAMSGKCSSPRNMKISTEPGLAAFS
ncbi:hypothetical protein GZ78_05035 [Endozoicomonas numazuensis]|uniref:Uncharacterized protein n=1 Tax=Endozoicomonas numazuensis TaxID=1137799 RepID=A0A081NLL2_9GAMM|nr:hypothetical protein GZ78_05035 [Endozoicomonas numazuensis]